MVYYNIIIVLLAVFSLATVHSFCGHKSCATRRKDRSQLTSLCATESEPKHENGDTKSNAASKSSGAGAGSWRAKAKEFQRTLHDGPDDSHPDRTLNIAFVTGNAMKQKEINTILSKHAATVGLNGKSYVNLRILDVDLPEIQGLL